MNLSGLSILIAEDDPPMRAALTAQLQGCGFGRVLQADSGTTALKQMHAERVHIVVSELNMPDMTGLALLEAMRGEPALADLPFVLMSGGLDRRSAEQAIRLGIGDLVIKPFTSKRLLERILKVLQRDVGVVLEHEHPERGTILVVDDAPENLQLVASLFRDQYKVKLAHNGEKAIAICQSDSPPDLMLLDVMMPGMDGFEVAAKLREHPASEHMPIIFVTGLTDDASREKGLSMGAVDYVFKPVDPVLMKLRVRNLMRHVEYQRQLQTDFDRLRELAHLRSEMDRLMQQDLKQPLQAILPGLRSLASATALNPEQQAMASAAEQATSQTIELLDLSSKLLQIEAGQIQPSIQAIPIGQLLRDLATLFQQRYAGKPVRLAVLTENTGSASLEVKGDATLCHSLFYSLFNYACDAAPPAGELEINLGRHGPVEITVSMPHALTPAEQAQFFKRPTGSPISNGYAIRSLAQAQGGDAQLLSEPSAPPTLMVISLPAAENQT
ncbi:hypothetical protein GCM10007907_15120 [Chitinimonas prasina]|uniref:Response regulatory domain-containing protein n=1 Tax=Chitinimonas prasina TaxID=1434937 RepID=A0ABQ5YCP3_9NEIS|nr:response regulator [Chitinimonas prasina]GLR12722.1 hypothetical protein GCM10007907_15120 [Chitinimonas prasina]